MTDPIAHIEEQLAFQGRSIEELSDVLARQTREIDHLKRLVSMLLEREAEREYDAGGQIPLSDQKPPHW